jgi:hypothetical protein
LHAEDQNLYSCNYLLCGAPKIWYCVAPRYYKHVVALVRRLFDSNTTRSSNIIKCPQSVMHKRFLIDPRVFHRYGIPTCRIVQYPGDLVITAPGAFHFGYNAGFNVAEATNFATSYWWTEGHFSDLVEVGQCTCVSSARFGFDVEDVADGLRYAQQKYPQRYSFDLHALKREEKRLMGIEAASKSFKNQKTRGF